MTSTRTKKNQLPKPLGAWKLIRAAIDEYKNDWKPYIAILAIVAVPTNVLALSNSITSDATVGSYISFAALIMNVALTWAIVERARTGVVPRPSAAYYDGGIAIVRFLLVTAALVLMLVPAALGVVIYLASIAAGDIAGTSLGEQLLIALVCLVMVMPSLWLLVRFGLAPVIAVTTGLRPIAALRYARRLTLGRFWRMTGRYTVLVLFLVALSIPIALVTALLAFLKLGPLAMLFFQLATTFTALPLANIYIFRLYRDLEPKPNPDATSETAA